MVVHELRIFRVAPSVDPTEMLHFFHRDGRTDLHAALRAHGIAALCGWQTVSPPGGAAEFVWIRAFHSHEHKAAATGQMYQSKLWLDKLKNEADRIVESVEAVDLTPLQAGVLLAGPRDRGFHELRHYRLANNAMPDMLAFFEDVREFVTARGVTVLASWAGRVDGTERFLWLREFPDAAMKVKLSKEIYESEIWLSKFKPRAMGVIEERILRDLQPVPADKFGGHDSL